MSRKFPAVPRKITIALAPEQKLALALCAQEDRRPPDLQAEVLVVEALCLRGYLDEPPGPPAEDNGP